MKRLLTTFSLVVAFVGLALAQRTVTGTVSGDGEGLVGASVAVKGASAGTRTDINGKYSLQVPAGSNVLVFTYTGYQTQEITLGASNVVDVTMAGNTQLTELLVTAIGIQRDKKALGYAASDIRSDQMTQKAEVDPIRALTGKVPGVNIQGAGGSPGMSTKINIRGNSSLTGNTQPLFVVDGVPFDNSVNASTGAGGGSQYSNRAFDIDPNNIESLTVLKGAAAAALYGSRATNGVVVITTKTGNKKGRKGLEVTFNQNNTWEQVSQLPEYQNVYGQGSNQLYNGGFIGNWGAPFAQYVDGLNAQYGTSYNKVIEAGYPEGVVKHPLVGIPFTVNNGYPAFFPELLDATGKPVGVPYTTHDFLGDFFNTGFLNESSLNVAAGSDKTSLSGTLSRMTNKGIIPESSSGRTTLAFGGRATLDNGLIISGNVNYVNTTQENPPIGGSIFGGNFGTAEGSIFTRLYFLPRNYNLLEYPFENPVTGDNIFYRALDNPLWLIKNSRYNSDVNRAFGNLALSYDVTSWLNLTARGGMNTYTDNRTNFLRSGSNSDPNGELWSDDLKNREIDLNYLATVNTGFGENFDLRFTAGLNINERKYTRRFTEGDNIISPGTYALNAVSTQIVRQDYRELQRLYGAFGDAQLSFKDYWFFGVTGRNDWVSTLPQGKNSFFYPSVNTALVLTDAFGLSSDALSFAKVRAAWSQVGNQADPYLTQTVYRIGTPFTTAGGSVLNNASLGNTLGNANLRNELTTEIELGADLRFFRNRIGLDFAWFKRNSTDQITSTQLPSTSGFNRAIVNAGEIENKGVEIGLTIWPFKSEKGFNWESNINFSRVRTLVVSAGDGGDIFIGGYASSLGAVHRTGQPYGQIFGTFVPRTGGRTGDRLIDKTTGTTLISQDADIIGDPNPDFILGWVNTFSWKGLSLNVLMDWKQGGDMYLTTGGSLLARGQLASTVDREPLRIIPGVYGNPGTQQPVLDENGQTIRNTVPVTTFDYYFSNGFGPYGADETNVYDATVIRLREVSLGYDLPKNWLSKTPLGSARVSVTGRNLWFKAPNFIDGLNLDPEVLAETAESNVQGFEYGSAPTTRRFGVTLSVTF
jgi:TonB-linked SusC/RagA family outer membrane protein